MTIHIERIKFGVVEPNHLSAPRDGGVFAQLPAADSIEQLENGQFVKYDYANDECNFTGEGAWMLVFNEEKLYDERLQMHRDYVQLPADSYDGKMYPRVFRPAVGDILTTNTILAGDYSKGDKLAPGADGILAAAGDDAELVYQVAAETTLPDGQYALKLQCIKAA